MQPLVDEEHHPTSAITLASQRSAGVAVANAHQPRLPKALKENIVQQKARKPKVTDNGQKPQPKVAGTATLSAEIAALSVSKVLNDGCTGSEVSPIIPERESARFSGENGTIEVSP